MSKPVPVSPGSVNGVLGGIGRKRKYEELYNEYEGWPILEFALQNNSATQVSNHTQLVALSNSRFLMYAYHGTQLRLIYIQRKNKAASVRLFELVSEDHATGQRIVQDTYMQRYLSRLWGAPEKRRSVGSEVVWKGLKIEKLTLLFRIGSLQRFANGSPAIFLVATRVEPENGPALVAKIVADGGGGGGDGLKIKFAAAADGKDNKGEMYRVSPNTGNVLFPELGIRSETMPIPEPATLFKLIVSGGGNPEYALPELRAAAGLLRPALDEFGKLNETDAQRAKRKLALSRYQLLLNETFKRQELKQKEADKKDMADLKGTELTSSTDLTPYQKKVIALCQKLRALGAVARDQLYGYYDDIEVDVPFALEPPRKKRRTETVVELGW